MKTLQVLKEEQKALVPQIRAAKHDWKDMLRGTQPYPAGQRRPDALSWEFRHKHIAYCELRGRTREEIERPKEDNRPDEALITLYKADYVLQEVLDVA